MKVFVTGGAGFIGSHLVKRLVSEGHEVLAYDNMNEYYDPQLKFDREVLREGAKLIIGDILDKDLLRKSMETFKPDAVVHLAAMAGVRYSMDHAMEYIQVNIVGTQNLIDLCEEMNVPKVVYASTSCTMAGNQLPWKEDVPQDHQLNPYGYSKRTNECQFKCSKIANTVGLRFFTVYGPWGRPDMALFDFTKKILAGEAITVFNYGDMVRDFTYVDDIVEGIIITLEADTPNGEIYNIGRGEQVQLMDFIRGIEKKLGKEAIMDLQPKHPADTKETWSDCSKLEALGYEPKTSIDEGVSNFIDWYLEHYQES